MMVAVYLGFYQGWSRLNLTLLACFLLTGGLRLLIIWAGARSLKRVRAMPPDEREAFLNRLDHGDREAMERKLQESGA